MPALNQKEKERIRSFLDKHSTNEKPVVAVVSETTKGIRYVMRLEDALNFPSRNPTKNQRHYGTHQ